MCLCFANVLSNHSSVVSYLPSVMLTKTAAYVYLGHSTAAQLATTKFAAVR